MKSRFDNDTKKIESSLKETVGLLDPFYSQEKDSVLNKHSCVLEEPKDTLLSFKDLSVDRNCNEERIQGGPF